MKHTHETKRRPYPFVTLNSLMNMYTLAYFRRPIREEFSMERPIREEETVTDLRCDLRQMAEALVARLASRVRHTPHQHTM
jgi:hypothetical protein